MWYYSTEVSAGNLIPQNHTISKNTAIQLISPFSIPVKRNFTGPVILDPLPTREPRKEFGRLHPNNVGQGKRKKKKGKKGKNRELPHGEDRCPPSGFLVLCRV